MSVYLLKSKFQQLLSPIALFLGNRKVTPNTITGAAIALSISFALISPFLSQHPALWALLPLILLIRMGLNALDGMVASRFNLKSKRGEVLNEAGDVVSDTAIFIGVLIAIPSQSMLVSIFILLSVFSEYIPILMKSVYGYRSYKGPMGKSDRAALIGAIGLGLATNFLTMSFLSYILIIANLLLLRTIYNRATDNGSK